MRKLFGTDGIRGIAGEYPLTPPFIMKIGIAIAHTLHKKYKKKHNKIIIGKDTRLSCNMIENCLVAGLSAAGVNCIKVGVLPTPGISYLTKKEKVDAGIVISASHNPFYDNGIKIFSNTGFKLTDLIEKEIEKYVDEISLEDFDFATKENIGKILFYSPAKRYYIDFLKSASETTSEDKNLKVVLDCANGATSFVADTLFEELGYDTFTANRRPNGININDKAGSLYPEKLSKIVTVDEADIGLAFDGDGDRLIAVDETGQQITGDQLMGIFANYYKETNQLNNNLVVFTVMSNLGLKKSFEKNNIDWLTTSVGDRYVLECMLKNNAVIGGEDSGHIIFLDKHTTGDGLYSAVRLLDIMRKTGKKLSELAKFMKKFPQKLINIKVKSKPDLSTIPEIDSAIKKAENELKENGRILVRYSGTEMLCRVMVEANTKELTNNVCENIANIIKQHLT